MRLAFAGMQKQIEWSLSGAGTGGSMYQSKWGYYADFVVYPAAVLVMMVLAIPFAYFQRRAGGVGFRVFAGTMLGLVFFLLGRLFSYLGVINDWPPLFSAAFPVAAFVVFAAGMLWWLERR